MIAQPTGTVTLLFTDVEGSTRLLDDLGAELYAEVLEQHREVLRTAFATRDGFEVGAEGDSFLVAFRQARDAMAAARDAQLGLARRDWPEGVEVRVRMGLHTGEPLVVDGNYVGLDVHRAARIMAAGHGGQVLVSGTTAELLADASLHDLGLHRLKDLLEPIRLYQLEGDGLPVEFPPLRSLRRSRLPVAAWPLLGRRDELAEISELVRGGIRLVTLVGAGGSGKTRLALQAAAELADEFSDGVFFVGLAPLRDTAAVRSAIAGAVGLRADDDLTGWLNAKRLLLVLDNLEHLEGVATVVAELLVGKVVILATSRAPLHLSAEREFQVNPLPSEAAVELFVSRAAATGRRVETDATVVEVCRRLDNLPLAIELAAARSKLLAPAALLRRLDTALPLLTSGALDAEERQRTLRATIEWSHDLLTSDEQLAFRRLSVFRGSFTLEAAEAVTDARLEQVATLLDQSLIKPLGEDRFFLLETIREYAREQLERSGEAQEYGLRHARVYLAQLEVRRSQSRGEEALAWLLDEEDNLRAALDRLSAEEIVDAARLTFLLNRYWLDRRAFAEQRQRLQTLLARDDLPNSSRLDLLLCLAPLELRVGDVEAQEAAARAALPLTEEGTYERTGLLIDLGLAAARSGRAAEAVSFAKQLLGEVDVISDSISALQRLGLRFDAGNLLGEAGEIDAARTLIRETRDAFQEIGDEDGEAIAVTTLAQLDLYEHNYELARAALASTLPISRRVGHGFMETEVLRDLGLSLLGLQRRNEARAAFAELLQLATQDGTTPSLPLVDALDGIALSVETSEVRSAARLRGATARLRDVAHLANAPKVTELASKFEQPLADALGHDAWEQELRSGESLTIDCAIELAQTLAGRGDERH